MVIHIFKDGTTTTELKNVYVPKEVVESVAMILERKEGRNEKKKNASNSEGYHMVFDSSIHHIRL